MKWGSSEITMLRHATPARRRKLWNVMNISIGRPADVSFGPDSGETMIPWLSSGSCPPNGPWVLFARFKDESWVHCIASDPNLLAVGRVSAATDTHVLAVRPDPKQNCLHVTFHKQGKLAACLDAAGDGDDPLKILTFSSSVHPKSFAEKYRTLQQAIEGFFASFDTRIRELAVIETNGGLELQDSNGRAIEARELDEMAITFYSPLIASENPAALRLQTAIESGNVEGTRQAIADGASLEFLPDLRVSPLSIAFDNRHPKRGRAVARLLVEAGAPIDGYEWEDPPICNAIDPLAGHREPAIIQCLDAILELGANINVTARGLNRGSTPLHLAVLRAFPQVVQYLVDRGANLEARDAHGRTPLEVALSMSRGEPDVDSIASHSERAANNAKKDRRPTLFEFFVRQFSGTADEATKRRAQVVQLLRETPRGD